MRLASRPQRNMRGLPSGSCMTLPKCRALAVLRLSSSASAAGMPLPLVAMRCPSRHTRPRSASCDKEMSSSRRVSIWSRAGRMRAIFRARPLTVRRMASCQNVYLWIGQHNPKICSTLLRRTSATKGLSEQSFSLPGRIYIALMPARLILIRILRLSRRRRGGWDAALRPEYPDAALLTHAASH